MQQFPLLDLQSAWSDAHQVLAELEVIAATLLAESEDTWDEIATVARQATAAMHALGALPQAVLDGIAKDEVDLEDMEARADAAS